MRTELSGVPLLNWASKVAGLLVDELGTGPGDLVVVRSGSGWQTAGILLGAWWAGARITDEDDPDAAAAFVRDGADPQDGAADEVFVVSGHPLGAPSRQVAAHQRDFSTAVMGQADRFGRTIGVDADLPALTLAGITLTTAELSAAIVAEATASGLRPGDRLLTRGSWDSPVALIRLLLGPLAAGAGVIHVGDLDPADEAGLTQRARSEGAGHTRDLTVPGIPALD